MGRASIMGRVDRVDFAMATRPIGLKGTIDQTDHLVTIDQTDQRSPREKSNPS
jgi:hypothetical protein